MKTKQKNNNNQRKKSEGINNPINTTAGKIVIWVLLGAMVLSPVIALIISFM